MVLTIGLDFGTTNTVATMPGADGKIAAVRYSHDGQAFDAFRSVLCFSQAEDLAGSRTRVDAGPWAIDRFREMEGECRFIQSFKTFAASPQFTDTLVFNRRLRFEDLLSAFLQRVRHHAGIDFPGRVVMGRPVSFAGASPDAELARTRYEAALHGLGFEDIIHVYEPVAAAYFFAQRLTADATILVADFGGGTSDFSIVRFSVGKSGLDYAPLAHTGVAIAGDAFDSRIIDHVVARAFGKGSEFLSWGKPLPVPMSFYTRFSRWNELSLMRHSRDYRDLQDLLRDSLDPDRIRAFLAFLDADAGYALYRAVSAAKMQLSQAETGVLSLHLAGVDIERTIRRAEFDEWIAPDLAAIGASVDRALVEAGLAESGIDRVFLTGGSSFVPAVRAIFESRFGAARVETGDQLVSIAYGLSLIGREPDIARWTV